jgi:hypothetical protein
MSRLISNNLLGVAEAATLTPMVAYRIDRDGHPYVPIGDGGVVLGVKLGDSVFSTDTDHVAPGVTLVHSDPAARFALTAYACVGNRVTILSGAAAGAHGRVLGKRGESGRVIAGFADDVLRTILPGDRMSVRSTGQGFRPDGLAASIETMNIDPALFELLPIDTANGVTTVSTVAVLPSSVCGNGIGRPAQMWDVDLAVVDGSPVLNGLDLSLGDLVAIENLDVRHNMGYRRDWLTVGIICHGGSPLPGHGPGLVPVLCGPKSALHASVIPANSALRPAVTESMLSSLPGGVRK